MDDFRYLDICVSKDGKSLTIENSEIKRILDLSKTIPKTTALYNKLNGKNMASPNKTDVDFSFIGFNMPDSAYSVDFQLKNIEITHKPDSIFESDHVEVELTIVENIQRITFKREYLIYPNIPTITSRTSIESETTPRVYWNRRRDFNAGCDVKFLESIADCIQLSDSLKPTKTVKFVARTDVTDTLVIENTSIGEQENGNLLFCADDDGDGLFILQEAPPSEERRDYETHDFRISGQNIYSCGWGIEPSEIGIDELRGYRHVIGLFSEDGTGGTSNLKRYLNAFCWRKNIITP
jgi:hypothetical protein